MRRITAAIVLALMALCASVPAASPAVAGEDAAAIRQVLLAAFDTPQAPLAVDPVVVAGDHAIADWSQGARGGRALLRRSAGRRWVVVLCAGDAIRSTEALRQAGVPPADATALVVRLAEAEGAVPAARLALFATFEGVMTPEVHPQR